jgi:hypothetical protein
MGLTKIQQLEAMPIYGNAFHDQPLFTLAHAIAIDVLEPMENRIRALRKIDEAMGEEDASTPAAVQEYCDFYEANG